MCRIKEVGLYNACLLVHDAISSKSRSMLVVFVKIYLHNIISSSLRGGGIWHNSLWESVRHGDSYLILVRYHNFTNVFREAWSPLYACCNSCSTERYNIMVHGWCMLLERFDVWRHLSNYVVRYDLVGYVPEEIVIVWCMFSLHVLEFSSTPLKLHLLHAHTDMD